jgi:hypothetical protein
MLVRFIALENSGQSKARNISLIEDIDLNFVGVRKNSYRRNLFRVRSGTSVKSYTFTHNGHERSSQDSACQMNQPCRIRATNIPHRLFRNSHNHGLALPRRLILSQSIPANAVAPGPVWTALQPSGGQPDEKVENFGENSDLARPDQPVELAPVYGLLVSPEASFINGEVYGVTGGNGIAKRDPHADKGTREALRR